MPKTLKTEESIVIERPLAEVFAYLSNPENGTAWNSNVIDYKVISGTADEVGSVTEFSAKVAGLRLEATEELTTYEPNKRLQWRSKESRIGYTRELDFDSDGDGTRVTFLQEAEAGTGLFKFADPIVQRLYTHDVRGNLEKAKTILES
ncbi:SRPBCC family protein [Rhodococcus tukisamuensis]|uniref:Polyketide cyclase / dehydrase and lipid transport n=1 Tax=Rhodococcus tukisamuensis TaxID=168276 RepID=A0A1G6NKH0_9NOCA|nr:SRPBCC family protein [Rhodococcus tukisamuensis]SDC67655.1 Polyketide cyclase / dehydrase and lipid transport [Rhodococcus tukisamuensis]